jgi:nitroreductase
MGIPISAEQVDYLIRTRRSIHPDQFVPGKKIPDEIVLQMLENANWAPNHKNTEPWRFVIFKGDGLKKLATFQAESYRTNAKNNFREDKYQKLLTTPLCCSHVLSIGMKRSREVSIPETEELAAVACAVQNLYLSTVAYGLGGYWSTGGVTYTQGVKPFFGLDEADRLLGFFYLGYIQTPPGKGSRKPIGEKIVWVSG